MTALLEPPDAAGTAATTRIGCTLRVTCRGQAERTYALTDGKCTIGSSSRCQICLPATDARPLQCLVALEADVATVTRWAAGVLLNGCEFATAPLGAGDRLSIGPWEIDVQSIAPRDASAPADFPIPPAAPAVRETQDFIPHPVATPVAPPPPERVAEPVAEFSPAIEPLPPRPTRASAKTIHMGDETPPLLLATPTRLNCSPSQAFADRVLVQLWTANQRTRARCKSLIAALRDERGQAAHLAAAYSANESARLAREAEWSATETAWLAKEAQWSAQEIEWSAKEAARSKKDAEWAAFESQANQWKTRHISLEGELSALQRELAEANSTRGRLAAELEALANDKRDASGAEHEQFESLTESQATLEQELVELRRQLSDRDDKLQTLAAERTSAVEALHVLDRQLRLEQERYEALVAQNYSRPQEPDAGLPAAGLAAYSEPLPAEWPAATPADFAGESTSTLSVLRPQAEEPMPAAPPEPSPVVDHQSAWVHDWRAESAEAAPWPNEAPLVENFAPATAIVDELRDDFPHEAPAWSPSAPAEPALAAEFKPAAEESKTEFVPVSFIDRYRNLLDDDADADFQTSRRSLLDDEFLSPKQAEAHDDPAEDADEALEAYMANLMRRVRGDSPPAGPTPGVQARAKRLTPGLLASDPDSFAAPAEPEPPVEPLDLESIKRTPRRPLNLDLTALREIANVTARTDIAEHRQRRHVESIITKVIISAMGVAAGAYALLAAPSFDSPWFWAGCLAATTSAGLAVQLTVVLRRRMNRRRRHLDPQAAAAAPMLEPAQNQISELTTEHAEIAE